VNGAGNAIALLFAPLSDLASTGVRDRRRIRRSLLNAFPKIPEDPRSLRKHSGRITLKKFLITSALVGLLVGFGVIVSQGPAPTQPATPAEQTTQPATAAPATDAAAQVTTGTDAQTVAPAESPTDAQTPTTESAAAPAQPAAAPTTTPPASAKSLQARAPAGVTAIAEVGVVGSLDPAVAPYRLTFTRAGAGISEIIFADVWKTAEDRRAAQSSRSSNDPQRMPPESARFVLATSATIGTFTVPAFGALFAEIDGTRADLWGDVWAEVAPGRFVTEIADSDGRAVARVERAFVITPGGPSHELMLEQRVVNTSGAPMRARLVHYGPGDLPRDVSAPLDIRRFHFGYLYPERRDPSQSFVSANGQMLDRGSVSSQIAKGDFVIWPNASSTQGEFSLSWFGTTDRYFALAVRAPFAPPGRPSRALAAVESVQGVTNGAAGVDEQLLTSIWTPVVDIAPDSAASFDMGVYAGPLDPRILERVEPFLGLNMGELILYTMGGCCSWCTFAWLADALLWFLAFIHDYVVFDWGLAIIGLVVVVRLILHPVQKKSQIAMQRFSRAMTAMKPELDALQKKFKDDPARMQQEQMRLFRERGVSPAGCIGGMLPIFAQMPIWMALYAVLFFAFDLRQQPVFFGIFQQFGGWSFLADLSAQDNFFRFPKPIDLWLFSLSSINLLPILMGIVFYFQQKYMSPPITPNMSEEQIQQQKIMKWMMVIMFPIMTYIAPSGLTLYILTSTCIGIVESRIIKKQVDAMDLSAPPAKSGKKGFLARVYEQALERAAQQQKQGGRGAKPRGKGR
jgi:YidC/Oxa1 family membrane protein insertase